MLFKIWSFNWDDIYKDFGVILDNLNRTLLALNETDLTLIYRFQERDLFRETMARVSSP